MYNSPLPKKLDIDLDYTSMIFPTLIYRSLKRKHYLLFSIATISLLFKIQVVLSSGLLQVANVEVPENGTLHLLDIFNLPQNYTGKDDITHPAYNVARNILDFNTSYPFGVTDKAAYQRFIERGSVGSPLIATVEALFVDFQCLKLERHEMMDRLNEDSHDEIEFVLDLYFEGCSKAVRWHLYNITEPDSYSFQYWIYNDTLSPSQRCANLPQGRQFAYLIASFRGRHLPVTDQVSGVMCGSNVRLSEARVTDNGVMATLKETESPSQKELDINIWQMIVKSLPWTKEFWHTAHDTWVNMDNAENPVWNWQHFKSGTKTPDPGAPDPLNTTDVLYESVSGLGNHIGVLFGHYFMRQERETKSERVIMVKVRRLSVHFPTAISMLSILGAMLCIASIAISRYPRDTRPLYMDPATLIGSMVFLHDHPTVTSRILGLQDNNRQSLWHTDSSVPYFMRTWVRTVFVITLLGVFAAIIATLLISQAQAGIGSPGGYWYLLWTYLPVLMMLVISLYAGSCDTASRNLWILYRLSTTPSPVRQLHFSMFDMSGPRSLLTAWRLKAWPVWLSQSLALFCALLTTIASILFTVDWNTAPSDVQLGQNSWFADKTVQPRTSNYEESVTRLLIGREEGDLPYPSNTYDKYLFPALVISPISGPNVSILVEMPAASLEPFCTKVADQTGDISIISKEKNVRNTTRTFYSARILFDVTLPNGTAITVNESVSLGHNETAMEQEFFGVGDKTSSTSRYYLWGSWDRKTTEVLFLRGWHCNYVWMKTLMDVKMAVVKERLVIDLASPPNASDGTLEPWSPSFSYYNYGSSNPFWPGSEAVANDEFDIDAEMLLLLKPSGSLSPEAFGDPSLEDEIKNALNRNWAFVRAQVANRQNRLGLNDSAVLRNLPREGLPQLSAKLIDLDRRRLVQGTVPTCLLLTILGLVIIVNTLMLVPKPIEKLRWWKSEFFNMDVTGLAPDGFNSISMLVDLLHSSNALQYMPSQSLSDRELYEQLGDLRFRLGWFEKQVDKTKHFTIGVEGDDDFIFLGEPMDREDTDSDASSTSTDAET